MSYRIVASTMLTGLVAYSCLALLRLHKISSVDLAEHVANANTLNIESRLALGLLVPLSECDVPDVEMMPKIGPSLANKLIANRHTLISRARIIPNQTLALTTVKGIGPSKAEQISRWLKVE